MDQKEALELALKTLSLVDGSASMIYRGVIPQDEHASQAKKIMDACHQTILRIKGDREEF